MPGFSLISVSPQKKGTFHFGTLCVQLGPSPSSLFQRDGWPTWFTGKTLSCRIKKFGQNLESELFRITLFDLTLSGCTCSYGLNRILLLHFMCNHNMKHTDSAQLYTRYRIMEEMWAYCSVSLQHGHLFERYKHVHSGQTGHVRQAALQVIALSIRPTSSCIFKPIIQAAFHTRRKMWDEVMGGVGFIVCDIFWNIWLRLCISLK